MKKDFVFRRVEKKYVMTDSQYTAFLERISPYMQLDEYGLHTICNIYYDTEDDVLISRSIDKPVYKEKLRLRTYGVPDKDCEAFIEIKKKYKGVVYKRRVSMSLSEAENFLNNGVYPKKDSQILREIAYFMSFYHPIPKICLVYEREAYFGIEDPEFRLTIDHNIRCRYDELSLEAGAHGDTYFSENEKLMEIKINSAMPLWLSAILTELEIYPVSFSKFGRFHERAHHEEKIEQEEFI